MRKKIPEDWELLIQYVKYQCSHGVQLDVVLKNLGYQKEKKMPDIKVPLAVKPIPKEMKFSIELSDETKCRILRENMEDIVMSENNTQKVNKRIEEIYEGMKDLNVYKNTQYGNIGSEPLNLLQNICQKKHQL